MSYSSDLSATGAFFKRALEDDGNLLEKTLFEFNEVKGKVKYADAWAAGGTWIGFKFVDGQFKGRTIYCSADLNGDPPTFKYLIHAADDGFLFNKDPDKPLKDTETECPGGFYPEWSGVVFTMKSHEEDPTVV